jgi:hypothetical protein
MYTVFSTWRNEAGCSQLGLRVWVARLYEKVLPRVLLGGLALSNHLCGDKGLFLHFLVS